MVFADRVQLQQVLINLLVNAGDAMQEGEIESPQATITSELLDGGSVRVCVADNGKGIAEEELDRLFQPFFSTKAKGMGMGLAITRTIIEAHGGRIWATNRAVGGARIGFDLPAKID